MVLLARGSGGAARAVPPVPPEDDDDRGERSGGTGGGGVVLLAAPSPVLPAGVVPGVGALLAAPRVPPDDRQPAVGVVRVLAGAVRAALLPVVVEADVTVSQHTSCRTGALSRHCQSVVSTCALLEIFSVTPSHGATFFERAFTK